MRKLALIVSFLLFALGCAEQRLYVSYYTDKVFHPGNPKVLTFYGTPDGQLAGSQWTRLCDVTDCTMPGPAKGAGVFTPSPKACYQRWWKECDGKNCKAEWWDKCTKDENAKAVPK
jgi:hypothetical protein